MTNNTNYVASYYVNSESLTSSVSGSNILFSQTLYLSSCEAILFTNKENADYVAHHNQNVQISSTE
jgi:hypothetical protein